MAKMDLHPRPRTRTRPCRHVLLSRGPPSPSFTLALALLRPPSPSYQAVLWLTKLEVFAALIAAYGHDAGHPAVSAGFLIAVRSEIALLHNGKTRGTTNGRG